MARLSIAVLALLAVAATVSAGGAPPGYYENLRKHSSHAVRRSAHPPSHGPDVHDVKSWLAKKEAEIKSWADHEKSKIQTNWKQTVVPQVHELTQKFGKDWQKKAPSVFAILKQKAGAALDKAIQFVKNLG
ncbi:Ribosomal protein S12 methylthiotransferase [Frankliniella fusca]|uniref:Ribosomal protein S12 methylthiotransferase n=1 Tax=Frankliniella fusca TaxID=407009 RepID=A0AAE1H502_9NEOP|nr:Ribosomal protein S12 methylthiotransferase [Frankliniella fusca]KAK3914708.1 Ribosomal protein S12 methylthiotransferase [Frankliniella fusca]KAK3915716.1 Ribosomal protein S12 methylthiotransferase [Frankliniella fusca]KAK3916195.1 Ribosomal protein S12 methylthiotransferase [Frankliniella fusca]